MAIKDDILAGMRGDETAFDTKPKKERAKSPAEMVAGLSQKQRDILRARAEAILEALDALEAESESEPDEEEEMV